MEVSFFVASGDRPVGPGGVPGLRAVRHVMDDVGIEIADGGAQQVQDQNDDQRHEGEQKGVFAETLSFLAGEE